MSEPGRQLCICSKSLGAGSQWTIANPHTAPSCAQGCAVTCVLASIVAASWLVRPIEGLRSIFSRALSEYARKICTNDNLLLFSFYFRSIRWTYGHWRDLPRQNTIVGIKYAFFSVSRDLQDLHAFTPVQKEHLSENTSLCLACLIS